jgi:alpha-tubulin suppressor-like RCC1 family protein
MEAKKTPQRVEISPSTWLMAAGDTLRVMAEVIGPVDTALNHYPRNLRLHWSSLDPAVRVVDSLGILVPIVADRPGRARVVLQAGEWSDTLLVRVGSLAEMQPRQLSVLDVGGQMCGWQDQEPVSCWGGLWHPAVAPRLVRGAPPLSVVSAGRDHACGLNARGDAYCWGQNGYGQLGDGTTAERATPVCARGGHRFRQLSAGSGYTCGATAEGEALCWGRHGSPGAEGALGRRYAPDACGGEPCHQKPIRVAGDHRFVMVSAGSTHTCGLTEGGQAFCWGANQSLQLGVVTPKALAPGRNYPPFEIHAPNPEPVRVDVEARFSAITVGDAHSCALTADGRAFCWGDAEGGVLGLGDDTAACAPEVRAGSSNCRVLVPQPVAGELHFRHIDAGADRVCGLTLQSEAYCWGRGVRYDPAAKFRASYADRPVPLPQL